MLGKVSTCVLGVSVVLGAVFLHPEWSMCLGDVLGSLGATRALKIPLPTKDGVLSELRASGYLDALKFQNPPQRMYDTSATSILRKEFQKARVLVIGGSKGIGRGIAEVFGKVQADTIVTVGRSPSPWSGDVKLPDDVKVPEHVQADLVTAAGCRQLVKDLSANFGEKGLAFTHLVFTLGAWPDWKQPRSPDGFDRVLQIDIVSRAIVFFELQKAGLLSSAAQITSVLASAQAVMPITPAAMKEAFQKRDENYSYTGPSALFTPLMTAGKSNDAFMYEAAKNNPGMTFIGGFPGIVRTEVVTPTLGSFGIVMFNLFPGAHTLEETGFRHLNIMLRARQLRDAGVSSYNSSAEPGQAAETEARKTPANVFYFDHTVTAREPIATMTESPEYGAWLWEFLRAM